MRPGGWPLRRQLLAIVLVACSSGLLVAGGAFLFEVATTMRQTMLEELTAAADMTAANCSAAVLFEDAEDATQVLDSLRHRPSMLAAAVYRADGTRLAAWRAAAAPTAPTAPDRIDPAVRHRRTADRIVIVRPIRLDGDTVGWLALWATSTPTDALLASLALRLGLFTAVAVGLAMLLSLFTSRLISRPIGGLVEHMRRVAEQGDYRHQARGAGSREVRELIAGFNGMLGEIASRDEELRRANEDLDRRVRERTVELELARDDALAAARAKSDFLAVMSHEIRTPLNGVIGMTELLELGELEPDQRGYLQTIRSSGDLLLGIINDILDFSKLEAGRVELEKTDFDGIALVEEVAELAATRIEGDAVEVLCDPDFDGPRWLQGDPVRLRQVLLNLVGNAIKFTHVGHVHLRVRFDTERERVRFSIEDTGIGMDEAARAQLFTPFTQADVSTTRKYGGTGLGLAICHRLVAAMQGTIEVDSRPGEGSTFAFEIPYVQGFPRASTRIYRLAVKGMRALVVDDHAINRAVLERHLASHGMVVTSCAGAQEAVTTLRSAHAAGEPFQLLISDMVMPEHDGLWLGEAIRSEPGLGALPAILLSSTQLSDPDRRRAKRLFRACLTKPTRSDHLLRAIRRALGKASTGPLKVDDPRLQDAERRRRPRVLVAEDNPVNQRVAGLYLERLGCESHFVEDGHAAVAAIDEDPTAWDLVLMDCRMPGLDGYQATRQIRERHPALTLTIIALTANAVEGDRDACLEAGMDDYLAKPLLLEQLRSMLDSHLAFEQDEEPANESQ